jgi:hypothetical protein
MNSPPVGREGRRGKPRAVDLLVIFECDGGELQPITEHLGDGGRAPDGAVRPARRGAARRRGSRIAPGGRHQHRWSQCLLHKRVSRLHVVLLEVALPISIQGSAERDAAGAETKSRRDGSKRPMTPMFLVIVALGSTDLRFALDSIPAIYELTISCSPPTCSR